MPGFARPRKEYIAYIDEAGDEGFGKLASDKPGGQSRWLAVGACVVNRENDLQLPAWRNQILDRFPQRKTRDLHFRNLKHEQKVVACQEIARLPLHASIALFHKAIIPGTEWERVLKRRKGHLYNYLICCLLEKITQFCWLESGAEPVRLKIVFSRRANTDYAEMRSYLTALRDLAPASLFTWNILWDVLDIDDVVVEHHEKWAGLQIADVVTSAVFVGFEPNHYGSYEHAYAKILHPKLMKGPGGSRLDSGLTIVPRWNDCGADELQTELMIQLKE